jgi:hypothetical protein
MGCDSPVVPPRPHCPICAEQPTLQVNAGGLLLARQYECVAIWVAPEQSIEI